MLLKRSLTNKFQTKRHIDGKIPNQKEQHEKNKILPKRSLMTNFLTEKKSDGKIPNQKEQHERKSHLTEKKCEK